jgi:ABC-type branched-subunit amino acid transport system ATPase component
MNIQLPTKKGEPNTDPTIEFQQLVLVGANGSGKTRFGSRIEEKYIGQTHRISAQKSLTFPSHVSPTSRERAEIAFTYGNYYDHFKNDSQYPSTKIGNRWGGNLNTSLLNDYDKLLVLLHTEEYEESLSFKEGRISKPTTKLDKVQKIWEAVLPHRKLHKSAGVIQTFPTGDESNKYNASEMSDGERVIFYLIGEVVCARPNAIIIIDEPEMHIHKSLIKTLFDLIELERPDCAFIYLTHDIDFAFTRQNAIKIWAKSYVSTNLWDYEILNEEMPIPEQLYLEVLGSRKPVIFLEGDNSSIDYEIYEQVFSEFTLKPLGSCEKVIHSVKSFNEQNGFHHINSFGIIDRDRRQQIEITKLIEKNIWVLDVAEAENLLLLENIVKTLATHMGKNADDVFNEVKNNITSFFRSQLEPQIILHYKEVLKREFYNLTNFVSKNIADSILEIDSLYASIDKQNIYDNIKTEFETVLNNNDYNSILRLFNLKNALIPQSKVCELTGIKNKEEYRKLILTLLKKKDATSTLISVEIDSRIIKNGT